MQVENCVLKLMNRQLSAAFNAIRDSARRAARKRQALKFWTQRNLLAAFNAFRLDLPSSCTSMPVASRLLPIVSEALHVLVLSSEVLAGVCVQLDCQNQLC